MLGRIITSIKNAPRWAKVLGGVLGGLGLGGAGLYALRTLSQEPEEPQIDITPEEAQTPASKVSSKASGLASPKTKTETKIPTTHALLELAQYSVLLGQEYEAVKNSYLQSLAQYQEQLDKLLPAITVLAMKTPLSALTSEDLPDKVRTMFQYSRFDTALEQFPKLLQGYYIAKANGIDTTRLTEMDLITIADNPAFVQNVNENFIQVVSTIAEHMKLQMKTNLELLGKLKDEYKFKLDTLKATADFMKKMVDAILKEKALEIQKFKAMTDASYKASKLALEREKLNRQVSTIPDIEVQR